MSFVVGVLLMWLTFGVMSRKPTKLWLPGGLIISLLSLTALRAWTDLLDGGGWSEGVFVGGITGLLIIQLLAHRSKAG